MARKEGDEDEASPVLVSWSGGKDCALALREIVATSSPKKKILGLITTITFDFQRVSMHGVRRSLIQAQAASLGLPLEEVFIPRNAPNAVYEERFAKGVSKYGAQSIVFGDLFLADVRGYREAFLRSRLGVGAEFPLWGRDTAELARKFVELGFGAIVCTVDQRKLGREYCGREFDRSFIEDLPQGVDPCGENGEFHTFAYRGPIFSREISVARGDVVLRDGFYFCDLILGNRS